MVVSGSDQRVERRDQDDCIHESGTLGGGGTGDSGPQRLPEKRDAGRGYLPSEGVNGIDGGRGQAGLRRLALAGSVAGIFEQVGLRTGRSVGGPVGVSEIITMQRETSIAVADEQGVGGISVERSPTDSITVGVTPRLEADGARRGFELAHGGVSREEDEAVLPKYRTAQTAR